MVRMRRQTVQLRGRCIHLLNLLDAEYNKSYCMPLEKAERLLWSEDLDQIRSVSGEYALATISPSDAGQASFLAARTLGVPARFACQILSPTEAQIIVAHTIREIANAWDHRLKPFDPLYTEMWPAFYLLRVDPLQMRTRHYTWILSTPEHGRVPEAEQLPADITEIGQQYVRLVSEEIEAMVGRISKEAEIGVTLSGGADSALVAVLLLHTLSRMRRQNRVRCFTLMIDGGGADAESARAFISLISKRYTVEWDPIEVPGHLLDVDELRLRACHMIEEYHARDLECAMAGITLLRRIRKGWPHLRFLFDGDGGNELFEDYPLADESYGLIALDDVIRDPHIFYLGYRKTLLPFNPVFSGGLSRAYVRTFNPARDSSFIGFSPLVGRRVVEFAQRLPLGALVTSVERLHSIRGEAVAAGVKAELGFTMKIPPKVRFQEGVAKDPKIFRVSREQEIACKAEVLGMGRTR